MEEHSPARAYAGVIGVTLVAAGIVGFFYNSAFSANAADSGEVFGLLDVNGWHNVFHILSGLIGLICFMAGAYVSRMYALVLGILYTGLALWGFIVGSGETIVGIIPINTADNVLHLSIGLLGLVASTYYAVALVAATLLLFGLTIPGLATADHDEITQIDKGRELFVAKGCANCHTLGETGSLGTIGPNLNDVKPGERQVLAAIHNGGLGSGSMPANLAQGADAKAIAAYVADASGASATPAGGPPGKALFAQTCGSCHTLADAGTTGTVGPNLDQLGPSKQAILAAIKNGGLGSGTMPANLLKGKDAEQVAAYVSSVAGK